jgi:hypothetical protein
MFTVMRSFVCKVCAIILLVAIGLAGCSALPFGRSQLNWVVHLNEQSGSFSATLGYQKTAGKRDFSAAQDQNGAMALFDSQGHRLVQVWFPEIGPSIASHNTTDLEETVLAAEWQQPLPPGDYRLVWGSQRFGYKDITFRLMNNGIDIRSENHTATVDDLLTYERARPLVNLAVKDLATRLGGQPDQIRVRSVAFPFNGPQGSGAEGYRVKLYAVGLQMDRDFYLYQAADNYARLIDEF